MYFEEKAAEECIVSGGAYMIQHIFQFNHSIMKFVGEEEGNNCATNVKI
jgi:hypothetical protein